VQCPVVLALNKVDLLEKDALLPLIDWYSRLYPFEELVPISALTGEGTDVLLDSLVAHLPPGPQYYPDDIPTAASVRFIVAEIIREKVFLRTKQEIPYSTAVVIDAFQEGRKQEPTTIHATILVEQDSQKGIIIGKKGSMLREIGKSARLDIEELIDQRVMLKLWVKVKKKWTKNESVLRELGLSGSGG
jgi:GTP-binding protein Era